MLPVLQIREEEKFETLLKYSSMAGYKEVAISFGSSDLLMKDDYLSSLKKLNELLDKYKLKCIQSHLPFYHLLVSSEEVTDEMERAIIRGIEATKILDAKWTAFHPRSAVNFGYDRKKAFNDNKEKLSVYLETAIKLGVGIAVENMPLYPYTNPEWDFFGGKYEELIELCDSLKCENIGICWDFGHAHTASIDQRKALLDIGDRLKITHIHDNFRNGDHHLLPLESDPFWGSIKWAELMPYMKKINYEGPMTLEIIYPSVDSLEWFVRHSFECVTKLIKLTEN